MLTSAVEACRRVIEIVVYNRNTELFVQIYQRSGYFFSFGLNKIYQKRLKTKREFDIIRMI